MELLVGKTMSANKKIDIVIALLIAIYLIIMFNYLQLQTINDDVFFSKALNDNSLFNFIHSRYMLWSGRLPIDILLATTINLNFVWKLMIPLAVILLSISTSRIITGKVNLPITGLMMALVILIPYPINSEAIYWVTGAYNYTLPFSLTFYCMSVFIKDETHYIDKTFSILALLIAGFNEQSSLCIIVIFPCLLFFKKVKLTNYRFGMLLLSFITFLLLVLAPGNYQRITSETINWLPEFKDYSIFIKFMMGADRLHSILCLDKNFPLIILSILILIKSHQQKNKSKTLQIASAIIMIWILMSLIKVCIPNLFGNYFFQWANEQPYYPDIIKFSQPSIYFSLIFILFYLLSLMYLASTLIGKTNNSAIPLISLLIGTASIMMLMFSPTIYASSTRTFFMFELCICFAASKLAGDLHK